MKKRKTSSTAKKSNRIPPSIPKCVKKTQYGYATDFIENKDFLAPVRFIFKKNEQGYTVLMYTLNGSSAVDLSHDITLSPATRHLFTDIKTLKSAIEKVEKWLGATLPDIR